MNDTPAITRRRSIMARVAIGATGGASFENTESYSPDLRMHIRSDLNEALGDPEEITVTVEPGDTLDETDGL